MFLVILLYCGRRHIGGRSITFFIVFYRTCRQPERRLSPFVFAYMAPRPSDEFPLIDGRFTLIWFARGMGP